MRTSFSTRMFIVCTSLISAVGCETVYSGVTGANRSANTAPGISLASTSANDPVIIPRCPAASNCIRVLSYNTKHRDVPIQRHAVANAIKADLNPLPDFILLQEVVFGRPKKKGLDNTAAELAQLLGYECRGTAREDGMEGVAIISRCSFEHYECKHLQARDSLFSGGFPRVSIMGEFLDPEIGRIRVVNVHLAYQPSKHDTRRTQLKETLIWMADRQRKVAADVIILGGDFNIEPEWDELKMLQDAQQCGGLQFIDGNTKAFTSGDVGNIYRRVDYLFAASPQRTITSSGETVLWPNGIPTADGASRLWPSDHLPVLQVFSVDSSAATRQ